MLTILAYLLVGLVAFSTVIVLLACLAASRSSKMEEQYYTEVTPRSDVYTPDSAQTGSSL